jgi:hypothetical protein
MIILIKIRRQVLRASYSLQFYVAQAPHFVD